MNEYKRHAFVKWDDNGRWLAYAQTFTEEPARKITEKEWEKMLHVTVGVCTGLGPIIALGLAQKKKSKKCVFDE
jgi:hypothetical protein